MDEDPNPIISITERGPYYELCHNSGTGLPSCPRETTNSTVSTISPVSRPPALFERETGIVSNSYSMNTGSSEDRRDALRKSFMSFVEAYLSCIDRNHR